MVKRKTICFILCSAWLLLGSARGQAQPSAALDLREILRYALQHAPKLTQAQEAIRISDWQLEQARAKFLPSVDLTTSQGLQRTEPSPWATTAGGQTPGLGPVVTSPSPGFSQLNLSITETFYDNGQALTQRDISQVNKQLSQLTAEQERDSVLLAVSLAYYSLAQATIVQQINQQQYQLLAKQLRQLKAMYEQGLKPKKEFLRLQSQAQRAEVEVKTSATAVRAAETELKRSMGAPLDDDGLRFKTTSAEEAIRQDLQFPTTTPSVEHSYVARLAQLEDVNAASNVALARRKNLPQLTFGSGASYQNQDYLGLQGRPLAQDYFTWNITIGINYNLWDSGSRRRDIDIAATQRAVHSEDTRDKLASLAADISKLMDSLRSLKETWLLNRQLIALEQQNYDNLQADYSQGKVQYLDLVAGLNDLLSAKVSFYSSYFSILQALVQYRYHEGTIYGVVAGV